MSLGSFIKSRRTELGLSQVQLAKKALITQGSLSLIEGGQTKSLSGSTLLGIASALQVDPHVLNDIPAFEDSQQDDSAILAALKQMSPRSKSLLRAIAASILEHERSYSAEPKELGR